MNMNTNVCNPAMPLLIEGGKPSILEHYDDSTFMNTTEYYINSNISKHSLKCFETYNDPDCSKEVCETALKETNGICSEAFFILGMNCSNSYEEAIEYFKKGIEVFPHTLKKNLYEKLLKEDWYLSVYGRTYYRLILALANSYRKVGNYEKALELFEMACKNNKDHPHFHFSPWINCYAYVPECLIQLKRYNECLEYIQKRKDYMRTSNRVLWLWLTLICLYQKKSSLKKYYESNTNEVYSTDQRVLFYLNGTRDISQKVPLQRMLLVLKNNDSEAIVYQVARDNMNVFKRFDGLIEELTKLYNTYVLLYCFLPASKKNVVFGKITKSEYLMILNSKNYYENFENSDFYTSKLFMIHYKMLFILMILNLY